jgi:hypothetical protein
MHSPRTGSTSRLYLDLRSCTHSRMGRTAGPSLACRIIVNGSIFPAMGFPIDAGLEPHGNRIYASAAPGEVESTTGYYRNLPAGRKSSCQVCAPGPGGHGEKSEIRRPVHMPHMARQVRHDAATRCCGLRPASTSANDLQQIGNTGPMEVVWGGADRLHHAELPGWPLRTLAEPPICAANRIAWLSVAGAPERTICSRRRRSAAAS